MGLLETINSPADVKKLELNQLPGLAGEVRRYIIDTIARTGGHFGGPLGCVEICIALHYALNAPRDKIVWDVGYQAYAHKILTGRRERFSTLRQWEGIAPFPRVEESPYDTTNPGHGSTSISSALGYAVARDLRGGDETVVAVVGDGSIVGGLAQEGLHQAGHMGNNLIILLNDNGMGISHNRSSMAQYLQRLRTDPIYRNARTNLEDMLRKLPGGELVVEAGQRVKTGVKTMVLPGMWFEELGLRYLGPINGHSINDLVAALKTARSWGGPVLIHAQTVKGKGYEKAEIKSGQVKWHAATPADLAPPTPADKSTFGAAKVKKPPKYYQVFSDSLVELAKDNGKIVAITAAMPAGTGIDQFIEKYPNRGFDVGMIEEHAATFAAGLALGGLHPVVAIYSTFLQRSFDQIIHDVCQVRDGLPVTFALDRGGLVGQDGATHQGVFDLTYLRCIPHMTIMAPRDEGQLRHMLKTSVEMDGASAVRYPRGVGKGVPLDAPMQTIPIGKGELLFGNEHDEIDLSVIAIGHPVYDALDAAKILASNGVRVAVFDARFAKPLDEEAICELAQRSRCMITVEENTIIGGFGAAVLELLHHRDILLPVRLLGVPDRFIHHGPQETQRHHLGLDVEGILSAMQNAITASDSSRVEPKVLIK